MTRESMKTKLLATTLFVGVSGGLWAGAAMAQDTDEAPVAVSTADAEGEAVQDRVIVTGSRLRRDEDSATLPISVVDAEEIELRSFVNFGEVLNDDVITFRGNTSNQGGQVQNGDAFSFGNILGLGTERTVFLLDGRRFVGSNQATVFVPGNATGAQVDLSIINPALIERAETTLATGGAIYGADAVGGVINVTTKDDFEGTDAFAQFGISSRGDSEEYQFSIAHGRNFANDRGNIAVSLEYFNQAPISGADRGFISNNQTEIANPLNGVNGPAGSDGVPSTIDVINLITRTQTLGGLVAGGPGGISGPNNPFAPLTPVASFMGGTITPAAFLAANPGINPLLFIGTFGDPDLFPRIPNTDPATSANFPFISVPLQFAPNGNLIPFNPGSIDPLSTSQVLGVGGDGTNFAGAGVNLRASTERFSAFTTGHFDLTPWATVYGDFLYASTEFVSVGNPQQNVGVGSAAAGSGRIPIYIDQNPFLNSQALGTINSLEAQGFGFTPTGAAFGGERVLFLNRNLFELTGFNDTVNNSDTYRGTIGLKGDFEALSRDFYWDTNFVYGRTETLNSNENILDIEFALATDVVADVNGNPVCRQQTLAAPESIAVRNPFLANITIDPSVGLTPTAAQVAACQPLNLFGFGAPSQAASDFVFGPQINNNTSEQLFASAQFGGDVIELPGGTAIFNTQLEYRQETNSFDTGIVQQLALARNANIPSSGGQLEFIELGAELLIPIFGENFNLPLFRSLEFEGAYRFVNRGSSTTTEAFQGIQNDDVNDSVYTVQGRWRPIDDLLIRGSYNEAVRSPSIIQLFGSLQFAFSDPDPLNPCTSSSIGQGSNPAARMANCITAATALGIPDAANFLSNFVNITTGTGAQAAAVGNPFLDNEGSESYTVGAAFAPSWFEGFSVTADWISIDLTNQIGLVGPATTLLACFDSADFPNPDLNGTNPCDQFLFAVDDGTGTFVVPASGINPLTGNQLVLGPVAGTTIGRQGPFQFGFSNFANLNLARTELRQLNYTFGYTFDLDKFLGERAANWGNLSLRSETAWLERFDIFPSGDDSIVNPQSGDTFPEFTNRFDVGYRNGKFGALFQWFFQSETVGDVQTDPANFPEQQNDFVVEAFNTFNLSLRYNVTDNVTAGFVVNNLTDNNGDFEDDPLSQFQQDAIGRTFRFRLNARF